MAYVIDRNKICSKCGKKRAVGVYDALKLKKMSKSQAEQEYCSCG